MTANPLLYCQSLGFGPISPSGGSSTFSLNGGAAGGYSQNWMDMAFLTNFVSGSKTINKIRVYCGVVGGTLGTNDLVCDVFSDNGGKPISSLASRNTVTAVPTGGAIVEFTGFSLSVTAQTQYHVVLRNANGTPGTNYPSYVFTTSNTGDFATMGATTYRGWYVLSSANGGSSWAQLSVTGSPNLRVDYSDGTHDGFVTEFISVTSVCYGSNEAGMYFTSPPNATLKVSGITASMKMAGSASGYPYYKLYAGSNAAVGTNTAPINGAFAGWNPAYFPTDVVIPPGTLCYVTLADSQADGPSNGYVGYLYTLDTDTNSQALQPFEGTMGYAVTTNAGLSFTQTANKLCPMKLLLDSAGEFGPASPIVIAPRRTAGRPATIVRRAPTNIVLNEPAVSQVFTQKKFVR